MRQHINHLRHSIGSKLILAVGVTLFVSISAWAGFNIQYQKERFKADMVADADRLCNTIKLGTHYAMMLNSRDDINQIIRNISRQKEIENIRIYNKSGQIKFSNSAAEVDRVTNIKAEACNICHKSDPPPTEVSLAERTRIFHSPGGFRQIGIISPIYNEPGCSTDACHVHPRDKKILGALDVVVSLEEIDREIFRFEKGIMTLAVFVFLLTATIIFHWVLKFVNHPIKRLIEGTKRLSKGDYASKVAVDQDNEMGQLARAINRMSRKIGEKQAELNNQRDEYQNLFENIPNPVFVLDMDTLEIRDCNRSVRAVYGYTKGDLKTRSFLDLFREEEKDHYAIKMMTASVIHKVRHVDKAGEKRFVNIRISPSEYQGHRVLLVTTSDITRRLETELQLAHAGKMATLGEMATGVAHELNQPLTVIKTASKFLMKKLNERGPDEDEILRNMSRKIHDNVDRAAKIINHMRRLPRKSDVRLGRVQVNDVLKNAFEMFRQQLKAEKIEIVWDIAEDLPMITADADRLEQVFVNLLINARHAIEEQWQSRVHAKGPKKITVKTRADKKHVMIELRDTGTGIPAAVSDKIFEPFFTTKEVGRGTGLGLSISYGIVKDFGGDIWTRPDPDGGACFCMKFPVQGKE